MRARTTLTLLLAVLAVGLFILLVERRGETTDQRQQRARKVWPIEPDRIAFLCIESATSRLECVREGEQWWLRSPLRARAAAGALGRILWELADLEWSETITGREQKARGLSPADYGLDTPRAQITVSDGRVARTLRVGRKAPLGGFVYVQEASRDDILAVPDSLLEILSTELSELRDRTLVPGSPDRVRQLGLQRPGGFVHLAAREGGAWVLEQPVRARADRARVRKLLDDLFELRIEKFVSDAPSDLAAYGFGEDGHQITFWWENEEQPKTLQLGSPWPENPGLICAKWKDEESVYAVPGAALDLAQTRLEELRDRRLMAIAPGDVGYIRIEQGERAVELRRDGSEWVLTEPARAKADAQRVREVLEKWTSGSAEAFVDDAGTNWAALGFVPPAATLTLARSADLPSDAEAATGMCLRAVVSSMPRPQERVLVRVVGDECLYEVGEAFLDDLLPDPLRFRDRTLLSLTAADIRKITLVRASATQALERADAEAPFVPAGAPLGTRVAQEHVDRLLEAVESLSVSAWVAQDPQDLSPFGLAPPFAELSLGLTAEAGIGRTVLLGDEAPTGERYVMVRGEDIVGLLSPTLSDLLVQDLVVSASEGATPRAP